MKTTHLLVGIYGEHASSNTTCKEWFRRFKIKDFSLQDKEHGKPANKFEDAELETLEHRISWNAMFIDDNYTFKARFTEKKWPERLNRSSKLIFQHDNAWPHVTNVVKYYLKRRNWEVLLHPPYSPDPYPSDYYLFRSM